MADLLAAFEQARQEERKAAFLECAAIVNEAREWAEGDLRSVRDRILYLATKPRGWKEPDDDA